MSVDQRRHRERAQVHEEVNREVHQNRLCRARIRIGSDDHRAISHKQRQRAQHVTRVSDRAVSEQAFDVRLDERAQVPNGRGYRAEALHGGMNQEQRDKEIKPEKLYYAFLTHI